MKEKIFEIIRGINEDVLSYTGTRMLEEGIIDSFELIDIISEIEDALNIEVDARYVTSENLPNAEGIAALVERIAGM